MEVCALSVWLESFTTWAGESLGPGEIIALLGQAKDRVLAVLRGAPAVVINASGPTVTAVFAQAFSGDEFVQAAALSARQVVAATAGGPDYQKNLSRPGIGLALGRGVVGLVKAEAGFEYAAIGQPVALSRRLAIEADRLGQAVLVDDGAGQAIPGVRPIDLYQRPGADRPLTLWALADSAERAAETESVSAYRQGLNCYYLEAEPERAAEAFARCLSFDPGDEPSRIMSERCRSLPGPVRIRGYRLG